MKKIRTKVESLLANNLIVRHVKNIIGAYNQWSQNRERERELNELLEFIPGRDEKTIARNKHVFETILRNQQDQIDSSYQYSTIVTTEKNAKERRAKRKSLLAVAKETLTSLQDTFDLVGVQPMTGPVGLIFTLQYKSYEDGKLSLEVLSNTVTSMTRKLQACYTMELAQDLKASHNIDVENEITSLLGSEIAYDISGEIVNDLITLAQKTKSFDFTETIDNYGKVLAITLTRAANDIARCTRRACGNYVLTSPMGIAQLETTLKDGLKFKPIDDIIYSGNVQYVGDIMNDDHVMFKVYSALAFHNLDADGGVHYLIGYKGTQGEFDSGYFFTPYNVLVDTGIQVNPVTFQPIQCFATRYGKHAPNNAHDYFRLVRGTLNLTPED